MKKKLRHVPKFNKEQQEREFWSTHDTTDSFDISKSDRVEIECDRGVEAPVKSIFRPSSCRQHAGQKRRQAKETEKSDDVGHSGENDR